MPSTLEVKPQAPDLRLKDGYGAVKLTVTKTSGAFTGYHGELESEAREAGWGCDLVPDSFPLDADVDIIKSADVTIRLTAPPKAKHGVKPLKVSFVAEDGSLPTEVEIKVRVPRPWWLQWEVWVIIALGIGVILLLAYLARFRPPTINISTPTPSAGTLREFRGVPFALVPARPFLMGSDKDVVDLPAFWIMQTEATNAQKISGFGW